MTDIDFAVLHYAFRSICGGECEGEVLIISGWYGYVELESLLESIGSEDKGEGAIRLSHNELVKIYSYLKSNSERYGNSFSVVMINLDYENTPSFDRA